MMASHTLPKVISRVLVESPGPFYGSIVICSLIIAFFIRSRQQEDRPRDRSPPPSAQYPIEILHDESDGTVDIVAVHGLAANPDYAWVWQPKNNPPGRHGYPDKHFNWLKDLLPTEMSSASLSCRVMAFNYDSKWFMDAPKQKLSDLSNRLLDSLRNKREKDATNRPLIFIGHSFGGNLIEQAIVSACQNKSEYADIAKSTVGVIFLGTPHRGSAAATWGALIASLAPPQLAFEDRILKDLEEQSVTLTDRLHEFSRWLIAESVPVICCFEQLRTDYSSRIGHAAKILPAVKELIVPESSACIDGHHKISLYTDHFKINKFYGARDPSFQLVYPEIERMAKKAAENLDRRRNPIPISTDENTATGKLRECLREMRVTDPRSVVSKIYVPRGTRMTGTCEWILKRQEFSAWVNHKDPQLFRIIGSPGIGKTMMSTFLIEVLNERVEKSSDKAFAYFFFDDKDEGQRTATAMLRSIIWQLLLQKKELFQYIQPEFDRHSERHRFRDLFENFSTLWRTFCDMLQHEKIGEFFILLDALDECERSSRKALLQGLRMLFHTPPGRRFKFLITCRPEISDIKFDLHEVGTCLRMDSAEVNADLSIYINRGVDELAERKRYSESLKQEVKKYLMNVAGGTFLWVSLMLNELKGITNYNTLERLKNLPKGLNETYTQILEENIQEDARRDAQFLLFIMVAARRPLKRKEIAASFALWKQSSMVKSQDLHDFYDICSSCSSIIRIIAEDNDTSVNFCHQSVKDFLLVKPGTSPERWFQTSLDSANALIFQVCWRHLSSEELKNGSLVMYRDNPYVNTTDISELRPYCSDYPFLEYAVYTWEDHAEASYPALLSILETINVTKAVELRDAWLLRAARAGQKEVVEMLCNSNANPETRDEYYRTPLSLAAELGYHEIVRQLLAIDQIDVESEDSVYQTALSFAARNGHTEIVQQLLATGKVYPDSASENNVTPLSWAAEKGSNDIVRLLLATGRVDVNTPDCIRGDTPLSVAASNGHKEVVQQLLATGQIDLLPEDPLAKKALPYAVANGHWEIVQLLLAAEDDDYNLEISLCVAAENGQKELVQRFLAMDRVGVNAKNEYGRTPLLLAAENGHKEIVQLLLSEEDINIDLKDAIGRTALSCATVNGHKEIMQLLRMREGEPVQKH